MKLPILVGAATLAAAMILMAQQAKEEPSWAPKAIKKTVWAPPHKPHTKLVEVKAQHAGQKSWRHIVVDDEHLSGVYVQMQPGEKVGRRFHPDTREWWIILEGEIKYTIEGNEPFVATKGSMVQVPMQTIYEMESVGDKPSLRYEVNIAKAHMLFPKDVSPPKVEGFEFVAVTLNRKPQPLGANNKTHINLYELAKLPENRPDAAGKGNFQHRFIHDDRAVSNIIYGYEKNLPAFNAKNKGHYHPECAESWLIMEGQVRYPVEYAGDIIASFGDVVYVPPFTYHAPRWHGEGASCRLAMNGYTNIAHLFESAMPH
ncbi:MAG: cupin domain-containing protein [Acidobacteria bacterium]|nr:cupin domain-containing protein [Acidobacteriota bacterium]